MNPASDAGAARAFHQNTVASATPKNIYKINNLADKNTPVNVNFPVQLGSTDPEDVKYKLRAQMVGDNGVVPNVGQAMVGPEYFDYITRKQDAAEYTMFQDYLMKQADWSSPEATEYWVSKFPWMLEKRLSEVDRVIELQKIQAKINITGPQSEQDWMFLWNKQRGIITVPSTAVHNLSMDTDYTPNNYTKGMFSPMVDYIPPFTSVGQKRQPNNKITWSNPMAHGPDLAANTGVHAPTENRAFAPART